MKVWSWRQAIEKGNLKPMTKLVLYTLANYMNDNGEECYPSMPNIAKATGLKERAVYTHIKNAEQAGYIIKTKRNNSGQQWASNEYKAALPQEMHVDAGLHVETSLKEVHAGAGVHVDAGQRCTTVQVEGCTHVPINSPKTNSPINSPVLPPIVPHESRDNDTELKPPELPPPKKEFEDFWDIYGYKIGKIKAEVAYNKARKEGVSHEAIIGGVRRYQQDCAAKQVEGRFIKHPATWLNGKHWQDEYPVYQSTSKPTIHDNISAGIALALAETDGERGY